MTDGPRPTEGEQPDPVPAAAGAPPFPAAGPPFPAAGPPYPAAGSAPGAGYPGGGYPGAWPQAAAGAPQQYGVPRQEYPGAPPTWGPPPASFRPPSTGSITLAVLALIAAVLGILLVFVLGGGFVAFLILITAVVLAVVSLARRAAGKGLAISALILAALAMVWAVLALLAALFSIELWPDDPDNPEYPDYSQTEPSATPEEYPYYGSPALRAPELDALGTEVTDPLAPGTPVLLHDDTNDRDVWQLTVRPLQDITATTSSMTEPVFGAFIAAPVELTNVSDAAIDLSVQYDYVPYASLITGDGGRADIAIISDGALYPTAWEVGEVAPGETVTYYEVFDARPEVATSGIVQLDLVSGQRIHWSAVAP
ncbi:DUF4190 domain-containing protein [Microbacterium sp. P05]|uniref:DUF4190 domain-containing protein n=1 Tax=Microbacterium sp. P05 TaxID=3366948 RepID=UPI0037451092